MRKRSCATRPSRSRRHAQLRCCGSHRAGPRTLGVARTGTVGNTAGLRHAQAAVLSTGHPQVSVQRRGGTLGGWQSSRLTTRGNPPESERVSAALAKPASPKSLRVHRPEIRALVAGRATMLTVPRYARAKSERFVATPARASAGDRLGLCAGSAKSSVPSSCFLASSGLGARAPMALRPSGTTGGARFRLR
jgi:hypothetical protein